MKCDNQKWLFIWTYIKTGCLWGWCNVARKCQQQDLGHSIVFIVFHQSITCILSTTSSSKPLVTWTNAGHPCGSWRC